MLIQSIKDLDRLMQLARKRGISELTVDGIKFIIDYTQGPAKPLRAQQLPFTSSDLRDDVDTPDLPSEEDLLFYSSGGNIGTGSYQSPAWQVLHAKETAPAKKSKSND